MFLVVFTFALYMCNSCRIGEVAQSVLRASRTLCFLLIGPHAWKGWEPLQYKNDNAAFHWSSAVSGSLALESDVTSY